jgi:hypothetical protein
VKSKPSCIDCSDGTPDDIFCKCIELNYHGSTMLVSDSGETVPAEAFDSDYGCADYIIEANAEEERLRDWDGRA